MNGALHRGTAAARLYVRMRRAAGRLGQRRRARLAATTAAIGVVAFVMSSWVVVPLAVGQALNAWAAAEADRRAAAERISVNPFTLTVTLRELEVEGPGLSVAAERVVLDFGIAALFGRSVALDALVVAAPRVRVQTVTPLRSPGVPAAFRISRATITDGRIEWLDDAGVPIVVDGVTIRVRGADSTANALARFDIDVRDALGGVATLNGDAALRPFTASGRAVFDSVDPQALAQRLLMSMSLAGTVSGAADFEWRSEPAALQLENMSMRGIGAAIDWSDGALAAARIEVTGAAALGPGAARITGDAELQEAVLGGVPSGADSDRGLRAARLTLRDAVLQLRRPAHSRRVLELASPEVAAEVAAGDGEEPGSLHVRAELDDARGRDVTIELQNMPASLFAAHAQRFAGYRLDGGRVDAALDYRVAADGVEGTALLGARGIAVEPLEGSADVTLALALLEGAHGVAQTAVDLRASLEAFEDGGIAAMLAAGVADRLETIAAAPFAALGDALGIDGAALETVSFPPGQAAPRDAEVLDPLAEALHARPRIGLRVPGVADPALDLHALAAQQIEQHVTLATTGPTRTARSLPVDFTSPRHRDVLDEFAGERLSAERRETIASYFTRAPDGRIAEGERAAYYRALFDALVANETIPAASIERLGRFRARAIADGLAALGVEPDRIAIEPVVVRTSAVGAEPPPTEPNGAAESAAGAAAPSVDMTLEVFVPPDAAR